MIPKIIHYVWVGDSAKPDTVNKCIESWKKFLPDYEIIEWNNSHHNIVHNNYSSQAYQLRKWAFVSDFLRVYALFNHGGVYLDTDVEITSPLDDFLNHDFFSGHEVFNGKCLPILTAVMGCKPRSSIMEDILAEYSREAFVTKTGLNIEPNTYRFTRYFENKFNIKAPYDGAASLTLDERIVIYPTHFFCTPTPGLPNYSIHHFNGSWEYGYNRRNKISIFSKYRIVRFRKLKHTPKTELPLMLNEKILFKLRLTKGTFYCLTATI